MRDFEESARRWEAEKVLLLAKCDQLDAEEASYSAELKRLNEKSALLEIVSAKQDTVIAAMDGVRQLLTAENKRLITLRTFSRLLNRFVGAAVARSDGGDREGEWEESKMELDTYVYNLIQQAAKQRE